MPPLPVITGLGFITSIGNDRAAVGRSLRELRHGFEPCTFLDNPALPVKVAGTIKGFAFPSPIGVPIIKIESPIFSSACMTPPSGRVRRNCSWAPKASSKNSISLGIPSTTR